MARVFSVVFCIALIVAICSAQVPTYLKICGRRDPDLSNCVKTSVEGLRNKLRSGIRELQIPSMEPLEIDEDIIIANSQAFRAHTRNTKVFGVSDFNLTRVNVNLNTMSLEIDTAFDKLKFQSDYDITARILVPISAGGPIEIDAEDITAKLVLKFKYLQHKGKQHIFFTSTTCKLTIRDYESHFIPRAGQDQTFSEAINNVLNSSKSEIIASISTGLERGVAKKIIHVANLMTARFDFDELLPDRE
uniref:Anon-3B1.2_3 protein n=1 Tax=Fopius arisanus TaxID=64838 RepID=A0A0C9PRI7_9HYME